MLPEDRLDSWKEVAAYLGRSVRTARRWERDEGLPIHRHVHRTLGSIYAHKSELDDWRRSHDRKPESPAAAIPENLRTKSIAVLPFTNLSTDAENEYLAGGLTEEITTNLSKVRALRVISGTSARMFRNTTKGVRAIAAELRVRYVVEGSVRRAGRRLRITAQLIDAVADEHLWADAYDGSVEDVFAMQERLARVIVDALELRISADEEQRLRERPIDNLPAYECYLRARHEVWRWRRDSIDAAVDLLQSALKIIGDNPRLYAALGLAYLQYREAGIDLGDRPLEEAGKCAEKLFALEPESASALLLRGWIRYSRGETQEAVRNLKAALDADASSADTLLLLSNCYLISGQVAAARPLITRLLEIDPLTPLTRCMPAWAGILEGDFAGALEPYRQMFEMDRSNPMARLFYVWVLILNERDEDVSIVVESFPQETRDSVPARVALFLAHARAGRRREALAMLSPEVEAAARATDVFSRFLAQGYALAEMPDQAMHWLEIAIARGFINDRFLAKHDPFFAKLRGNARLEMLLEKVSQRRAAFEA